MSPEQARGKKNVDARADLFSLAAILYQALSGQKLYRQDNFLAMLHAVAQAEFTPLEELVEGLPPGLVDEVRRALSRQRQDRHHSVRAFARALLPYASEAARRRAGVELSQVSLPPSEDGVVSSTPLESARVSSRRTRETFRPPGHAPAESGDESEPDSLASSDALESSDEEPRDSIVIASQDGDASPDARTLEVEPQRPPSSARQPSVLWLWLLVSVAVLATLYALM